MSSAPKRWRLTIFPKLFLAFTLLVAPLYGIALLMNKLGEARLLDELSKSLSAKVDFYSDHLEVENQHMVSLLEQYLLDKDIQHLTYLHETMSLSEFTGTINRVQSKLEQLTRSSIYAKEAGVHILTLNRSLSSLAAISSELSPDFEALRSLASGGGRGFFYWQQRMFLAIAHPGIETVRVPPGFILFVELDMQALERTLSTFEVHEQSGVALVYMEHDARLSDRSDPEMLALLEPMLQQKYEAEIYEGAERLTQGGKQYYIAYNYSHTMDHYLVAYIPMDQMLGPIQMYSSLLWALSLLSFVVIIAYSYWIYRLIHKPLQTLTSAFRKAEHGQLSPVRLPKPDDEFLYLFQRFNMMMEKLDVLIHQEYEQRLRAQSSELKQLQAQINPHFLYNTYFILYRLAKLNDNESIAHFSQYLGEYFQYITRNGSEEVPLEMEVRHSQTYAEIQSIRFNGRIRVEFEPLPKEVGGLFVPRLILQPIIENAYKHGLEARRKSGLIAVRIRIEGGELLISVEDDGGQLTDEQLARLASSLRLQGNEMEYTGLLNVHRRLQIRFGGDAGVIVERGDLGGLRVTLRLPMKENRS